MENWYAIRTHPNRETIAATNITKLGAEIYAPAVASRAIQDNTGQQIAGLIVRGYVFARADLAGGMASKICGCDGVMAILPTSLRPIPILQASMDRMAAECEKLIHQSDETPDYLWMFGRSFRVIGGRFQGHIAPCFSVDNRGRPELSVPAFGRLVPVAIDVALIDMSPVDLLASASSFSNSAALSKNNVAKYEMFGYKGKQSLPGRKHTRK